MHLGLGMTSVHEVLIALGAIVSSFDNALFIWYDCDGNLMGVLATHVDDFIYAGTEIFLTTVIVKLVKTFIKVSKACDGSFKYLGITIKQNYGVVEVDQDLYVSPFPSAFSLMASHLQMSSVNECSG